MANDPTRFLQSTAQRTVEIPNADWDGGGNQPASNAPGIGIATEPVTNLAESLPNWTLLDQDGDARTPQVSQHIGGDGSTAGSEGKGTEGVGVVANDASGNGEVTESGEATLADLAVGWTSV